MHCAVVPRASGRLDSLVNKFRRNTFFTHHQKAVVLDAPAADASGPPPGPANPQVAWSSPLAFHPMHVAKIMALTVRVSPHAFFDDPWLSPHMHLWKIEGKRFAGCLSFCSE